MAPFYAPAVAGIFMFALSGWLLWLSPERRQARAFSLLLSVRGLSLVALSAGPTATTIEVARLGTTLYPPLCLLATASVLYFLAVYPAPRPWLPRGMLGPALFFGPVAAVVVWAILDPNLVTPSGPPTDLGPQAMFDSYMRSRKGPIGVAPTLFDLTLIVPAFVLVRDYLGSGAGRKRSTLLLVSFGFFAPAACSCLVAAAFLQMREGAPRPTDPSLFNYGEMGVFAAWFVVMIALVGYLAIRAIREPEAGNRRAARMFAALVILSAVTGGATALFRDPLDAGAAIFVMVAAWSTLGALIVTYGVVRHSLFDIDVRFKRTLERGTVAAVFVAVYFLVSEAAAELFADFSGSAYLGIGAAALLLLALHPLERVALAFAGGAMPKVKPLPNLDRAERVEFYREHLELMWMDGVLSAKDRLVLAKLRSRLQLEADIAERIELEIVSSGRPQTPRAPRKPHPPGPG
jgi:hypothetical protein